MKKGIQETNPVLAFWQRVILDGRIDGVANKWRNLAGVPNSGFASFEEFEKWCFVNKYMALFEKDSKKEIFSDVQKFTEEMKTLLPYERVLSENRFKNLMEHFFYYNNVDATEFKELEFSQMEVKIIRNNKSLFPELDKVKDGDSLVSQLSSQLDKTKNNTPSPLKSDKIKDGIYIKISPSSTTEDILKYIKKEKKHIEALQDIYAIYLDANTPKKIKMPTHFERDSIILMLYNGHTNKELKEKYGVDKPYKEMTIKAIMAESFGYKVSQEVVKSIIQRRYLKK